MTAMRRPEAVPEVPLIPDDAPFTAEQRAWLSGFLMALLTPAAESEAVTQAPALPVAVLYASQTGTAEGLARKFARAAKGRGFSAEARDIGTLTLEDLAGVGHAVVIAATHGEGEPPDTARQLTNALEAATGTPLDSLSYTVLALGDSSYLHFCGYGVFLDERLAALGAKRIGARLDVDGDPASPFGSWRDDVLEVLASEAGTDLPAADAGAVPDELEDEEPPGTRGNPVAAPLIGNRKLTEAGSDKDVRHIALSLAETGLAYEPGDALGVVPENPPAMIEAILTATGFDGATPVTLDGELPLIKALAHHLSIGRLTQPTLIKFAKQVRDGALSDLLAPERSDDLAAWLYGRDVIDLLMRYPGVLERPQDLVSLLPRLAPRLYSIASSPRAHPDEVHLTVAAVRYASRGRDRVGIGSTYLADRAGDGPVKVYLQRNARFRLPTDPAIPVIMVGPGTGIAPFRAFLEERRAIGAHGATWLFFGDRRRATDFLHREELEGFLADGTLSRLDLAFSRDGAEKVYVQHRMAEHAAELWGWLQEGARFYVCGDAARMAKDVDRALRAIVARQGHMSEAEAAVEVDQMVANGRYLRDVY